MHTHTHTHTHTGHLSYAQDPQALRSLLVRPFTGGDDDNDDETQATDTHTHTHTPTTSSSSWELISAFTEDPHLLAFARHFCSTTHTHTHTQTHTHTVEKEEERESRKEAMLCAGVLYECLAREKPDLLPLHVYVLHVVKALKRGMSPVAAACTVCVCVCVCVCVFVCLFER